MVHNNFHTTPAAQTLCELLREIYRAVLTAGAAEGHHQVLESASLVITHAGIHQRHGTVEELMHAFLLAEIVGYWRVLASEGLEAFFPPGIRKVTGIEDEAATIPSLVFQHAAVIRKAEDPYGDWT